jgi:hypothetical protein
MFNIGSKTLTLVLMILSLVSVSAQLPVWTQLSNAPAGDSPRFDDIGFIDETNGWVARSVGGIHQTTDGGKTFSLSRSSTAAYPGTNLTAHFRSICFVSPTRGWAGNLGPGSYDGNVTDTNILFETFDGGTNWMVKPGFPETGMRGLCALYALDSQHIYGGGRVRGPAYFIKAPMAARTGLSPTLPPPASWVASWMYISRTRTTASLLAWTLMPTTVVLLPTIMEPLHAPPTAVRLGT